MGVPLTAPFGHSLSDERQLDPHRRNYAPGLAFQPPLVGTSSRVLRISETTND